jgi:hypothetical protein
MWKYSQSLKTLFHDKILVTDDGYSGFGDGKNNPSYECVRDVGPIPAGHYEVGAPFSHPTKGPVVMRLTPVGHDACGRTDFLIHGESRLHPGEASLGCIILKIRYRKLIAESHDRDLEVTS